MVTKEKQKKMTVPHHHATVRSIGGATFVFEIAESDTSPVLRIACDPVLCPEGTIQNYGLMKSKRLEGPVLNGEDDLKHIDLWLLTHGHEDHFDALGYNKLIESDAKKVIAHPGVDDLIKKIIHQPKIQEKAPEKEVHYLSPGEDHTLIIKQYKIKIKAVLAIHGRTRKIGASSGNANGYVVEIFKGENEQLVTVFYITGDSVFNEENLKHDESILKYLFDFVIANAGGASVKNVPLIGGIMTHMLGTITNTAKDVVALHDKLTPRKTLVVHHGTFCHYDEKLDDKSFENPDIIVVKPGQTVQVL